MRAYESSNVVGHYGVRDFLTDRVNDLRNRVCGDPEVPTVVHVTHAKAGSTWIAHLLSRLFGNRCAPRGSKAGRNGEDAERVFQPGRVYSGMFMTRDEVAAQPVLREGKTFIVIRDLRDTIVSLYFSLKISHPLDHGLVETQRETLQQLSEEKGLLQLIPRMQRIAAIQRSWIERDDLVLRYEDLVTNPGEILEAALIDRLDLPISRSALHRAIRRTHFQKVFKRKMGVEDVNSHGRNGLPGDWRNHFTPEIRRQFAEKFGDALVATGYENDDRWANASDGPVCA
jgi:hypothetical protein